MSQNSYLKCPKCGEELTVDRRRTGKASKSRGGNWEYKVYKMLSKITGYRWVKTKRSGGMEEPGDIKCISAEAPAIYKKIVIECKNREDINLSSIFKNPYLLQPYLVPDQVVIFNDKGGAYCIIPSKLIPALVNVEISTILTIEEEGFWLLPINYFSLIGEKNG